MTRRVVVTGVGLVCALGIGTDESWKNLVAGVSGIGPITHFDPAAFDCKIAGEVKNFDPFNWIEKKELKKMGRFIQLALAAADAAVKHADWKPEQSNLEEVGVYVSSGIGGFDIIEREQLVRDDVAEQLPAKVAALRAHATQVTVAPDGRSCALSNSIALPIGAIEHYILAAGTPGVRDDRGWESDLLAGLNLE